MLFASAWNSHEKPLQDKNAPPKCNCLPPLTLVAALKYGFRRFRSCKKQKYNDKNYNETKIKTCCDTG